MTDQIFRLLIGATLIGGMLHSPVFADTGTSGTALLPETALSTPFGTAAIDSNALDAHRGGSEVTVINDNMLKGVVSDNQAYNLNTGSNLVSESSFSGASGFATIIQNSGNNVLIQNSTIVNVQFQ